jgi:hypothetical protein
VIGCAGGAIKDSSGSPRACFISAPDVEWIPDSDSSPVVVGSFTPLVEPFFFEAVSTKENPSGRDTPSLFSSFSSTILKP